MAQLIACERACALARACFSLCQSGHNVDHLPVLWLTPDSFHAAGPDHLVPLTQKSPLWIIIRKPFCQSTSSWCLSAGVQRNVRACVCVCDSLFRQLWKFGFFFLSPVGRFQGEKTLFGVRKEERVKDYPDKVWWRGGGGWGTTTGSETTCSQDSNNHKLTKRTENIAKPSWWNVSPHTCTRTRCTGFSLPACGVIVKMSFQYLQRLVMQPAISFWQTLLKVPFSFSLFFFPFLLHNEKLAECVCVCVCVCVRLAARMWTQ